MGIGRMLGIGKAGRERRKNPRIRCRLRCTLQWNRTWIPARVMDVSEGGLCMLSSVRLQQKQRLLLRLDVPRHGVVDVEGVAWHVRRVKNSTADRRAWSVGVMITKAGDAFRALLPEESSEGFDLDDGLAETLAQLWSSLPPDPSEADPVLEEDALSPEELDDLDVDLLSADELNAPAESSPDNTLGIFRVRVKAKTGPRTRSLTFGAMSKTEAAALAKSELDEDWIILEVSSA